mmetsp:Transcript_71404/g.163655  ORF Transcript_71404/g.163655 Transcript_71404/m.163655 type:complete len:655 (+) Transcript_71404:31-1995(+)
MTTPTCMHLHWKSESETSKRGRRSGGTGKLLLHAVSQLVLRHRSCVILLVPVLLHLVATLVLCLDLGGLHAHKARADGRGWPEAEGRGCAEPQVPLGRVVQRRRLRVDEAEDELRGALLDNPEEQHHVGLVDDGVAVGPALEGVVGVDQPRAPELLVHAADDLEHLPHLGALLLLELEQLLALGLRLRQLLLQPPLHALLRMLVSWIVHPVPLHRHLVHLLSETLLLLVEFVDKLEELEVLLLRLQEGGHKLVNVLEPRRLLQLSERVLKALDVSLGGLVLGSQLLQLGLLRILVLCQSAVLRLCVHPRLYLAAALLLRVHLLIEVAPLGVKLRLALGELLGRLGDLLVGSVARLERHVGRLDGLRDLSLLLVELGLEPGLHQVEADALLSQVVDLRAQKLVHHQRLVEPLQRLLHSVLEHLELLLHLGVCHVTQRLAHVVFAPVFLPVWPLEDGAAPLLDWVEAQIMQLSDRHFHRLNLAPHSLLVFVDLGRHLLDCNFQQLKLPLLYFNLGRVSIDSVVHIGLRLLHRGEHGHLWTGELIDLDAEALVVLANEDLLLVLVKHLVGAVLRERMVLLLQQLYHGPQVLDRPLLIPLHHVRQRRQERRHPAPGRLGSPRLPLRPKPLQPLQARDSSSGRNFPCHARLQDRSSSGR